MNRCDVYGKFRKWEDLCYQQEIDSAVNIHDWMECIKCSLEEYKSHGIVEDE